MLLIDVLTFGFTPAIGVNFIIFSRILVYEKIGVAEMGVFL
jgi:hypothetical protein